jgi:hypothetical protein
MIDRAHADLAHVPCVDSAYWIAGSSASLLAGTTFLVASCVLLETVPLSGWLESIRAKGGWASRQRQTLCMLGCNSVMAHARAGHLLSLGETVRRAGSAYP